MNRKYTFMPLKGTIKIITEGLNKRIGGPEEDKPKIPLSKDEEIDYMGIIFDGWNVKGNSIWFVNNRGDFIWSGGVLNLGQKTEELLKFQKDPLSELRCTRVFGAAINEYYKNPATITIGHNGLDFRTRLENNWEDWKRDVCAVMDGGVEEINLKFGKIALIHGDGSKTIYIHLDSYRVKMGDSVKAGDVIGVTGETGAPGNPHLHFSYKPSKIDGNNGFNGCIDPTILIPSQINLINNGENNCFI